jgi:hypothetical protein
MNRSIGLAGLFAFSVWAMPGLAFAQSPMACSLISEKEALTLVGGPLGEISKGEQKPTPENANDHRTWCGFFPKGSNAEAYFSGKTDHPPERGLRLNLNAKRKSADAKRFYEEAVGVITEGAKAPGNPTRPKVSSLGGMGAVATLEVETIEAEPKVVYHVATVYFLKGTVSGSVVVWKKAAPADEIARAAAKQIIAKLP